MDGRRQTLWTRLITLYPLVILCSYTLSLWLLYDSGLPINDSDYNVARVYKLVTQFILGALCTGPAVIAGLMRRKKISVHVPFLLMGSAFALLFVVDNSMRYMGYNLPDILVFMGGIAAGTAFAPRREGLNMWAARAAVRGCAAALFVLSVLSGALVYANWKEGLSVTPPTLVMLSNTQYLTAAALGGVCVLIADWGTFRPHKAFRVAVTTVAAILSAFCCYRVFLSPWLGMGPLSTFLSTYYGVVYGAFGLAGVYGAMCWSLRAKRSR